MSMDDPLAAAQAARERVERQIREAEQRRDHVRELAQEVRELLATTTSHGGEVKVSARAGGSVTSIEITDAGMELSAEQLSRVVTRTVGRAQHDAAIRAVERSSAVLGEQSPLVEALRTEAEQAFPSPGSGADGGIVWND